MKAKVSPINPFIEMLITLMTFFPEHLLSLVVRKARKDFRTTALPDWFYIYKTDVDGIMHIEYPTTPHID